MEVIKNAIRGVALGDSIGHPAEFKSKEDAAKIVDLFPRFESVRDWPINDWTDDTDHLILILQSEGKMTSQDFAAKLDVWRRLGFPELGDKKGMGMGGQTTELFNDEEYLKHPILTAKQVWENYSCSAAGNGAMPRIVGTLPFAPTMNNIADLTIVTHYDPRCVVANHIYISILLAISRNIFTEDVLQNIASNALHTIKTFQSHPESGQQKRGVPANLSPWDPKTAYDELILVFRVSHIDQIALNQNIGYVFKTLAVAVWAAKVILNQPKGGPDQYKKYITYIARQGGDADTNCAVAGAIFGMVYGIPQDWYSYLPAKDFLEKILEKLK